MQEISNTFLWSFNREGRERESNVASILGNVRIELPSSQCEKTGEVDGSMSIDERLPSSTSTSLARSGPFLESQPEWKEGLVVRLSKAMARNNVPDLDVSQVCLGHVQYL